MKALACLFSILYLAIAPLGSAAEPEPPVAKAPAPAEAPEFQKLRDEIVKLERDPATASDVFLTIYQMCAKGEQYAGAADLPNARLYLEAAADGLESLKKLVPAWNPSIVEYRTKRVLEKLAALPGAPAAEPLDPGRVEITPIPKPAPAPKSLSTFREENRAREAPRKWEEREFNGEKLYVVPLQQRFFVPLMVTP